MLKLIVQRLIFSVITLTIVAVVVFAMTDLLPGDWATAYFGKWATEEGLAAMREEYGLNRPATERFAEWVGNALRGDFGDSLTRKKPVVELIRFRLRNSLLLGGLASLVTIPLATLLGIAAGLRRDRAADAIISTGSIVGMSTPEFVIGTLLIWALSVGLGLFPSMTLGNPDAPIAGFAAQCRNADHDSDDCLDRVSPAHGSHDYDQRADQRVCRNGDIEGLAARARRFPSRPAQIFYCRRSTSWL